MIKHSVKTKVTIAASVLLALVLGAFTLNNYWVMSERTTKELGVALNEISSAASQNISSWLNGKLDVVVSIQQSADVSEGYDANLRRVQQADRSGRFKNAYIATAEGVFILDDPSLPLPSDYDPRTRPWYQLAQQQRDAAFTAPYIDASSKELTMSVVVPMYEGSRLSGVAGADLTMQSITDIVTQIDFLGFGFAFLVNGEGKVLAHPDSAFLDRPMSEFLGSRPAFDQEFVPMEVQNTDSLVSFIPIQGLKNVEWYLGVVIDEDKAYASIDSFNTMALVYLIVGVAAIFVLMTILLNYLMRPMDSIRRALRTIAGGEGDLTQRLEVNSDDEFGKLAGYFNQFIEKIHQSISQVKTATEQLHHVIGDLVSATQSSMTAFNEQNQRTDHVATSVTELGASATEISANASQASALASNVKQLSEQSQTSLNANISSIRALSEEMTSSSGALHSLHENTDNIGRILEVIKGVSEQTNLLALNAAIEAARAGDAGRGFAVVADEVRQLAQRTQQSTQEIETMIGSLQTNAQSVVEAMDHSQQNSHTSVQTATDAGEQMQQVSSASAEIDGVNHAVAAATSQQTQVIQSLDEDVLSIRNLSQDGIKVLEGCLQACDQLKGQFDALDKMVNRFSV